MLAPTWNSHTVGELCRDNIVQIQTGPFGSQLHAHDYQDVGIPVVPTESLRNRRIEHSLLPKIAPQKAEQLKRHALKTADILFARRGVQATGHIGFVRPKEVGFICGTGAIRLRVLEPSSVSARFLSHVFANPESIAWFKFHAIGATMPNLNEHIIKSFRMSLPGISEQEAIADVLDKFDDNLELNRRMSETLEAMARALFKSWFVDFYPVRAKVEGRWRKGESFPGLPAHLYDLFPNSFENSELGDIPKGWRVGTFDDMAELVRRNENPAEALDELFAHYSIPAFDEGKEAKLEFGTEIKSQKSVVPEDAVLISKLNPEIPRVWLVDVKPGARSVCSTEFLVFRSRLESSRSYLYCHALSSQFRRSLEGLVTGTSKSHQRAQSGAVSKIPTVIPPPALVRRFETVASPILATTSVRTRENRLLSSLRDTLLPKLISGELRLNTVEKFTSATI